MRVAGRSNVVVHRRSSLMGCVGGGGVSSFPQCFRQELFECCCSCGWVLCCHVVEFCYSVLSVLQESWGGCCACSVFAESWVLCAMLMFQC